MKGTCKLCLLEKELLKKSHIIPEFMYQYIFDDQHRILFTTAKQMLNNEKPRYVRTGEYEGAILCKECDNKIIGTYESYASKAMFGKDILPNLAPIVKSFHNGKGQSWSNCENLDYEKYKLFLLSILWRANISSRDLFSGIKLGPHAEKIRKMILEGNAGEEDDYPIVHWTTAHDNRLPKDFVLQPRMINFDSHKLFLFPISGMVLLFYVSNHKKSKNILSPSLKKNGTMRIQHISPNQWWDFYLKYLNFQI